MSAEIQLEIRRPGRDPKLFEIVPGVYTVGSDEDCRIRLPDPGVEARHAILTVQPDGCWIEDLGTESGTSVNNGRIRGRVAILPNQRIDIASYTIILHQELGVGDDLTPPPHDPVDPLPEVVPPVKQAAGAAEAGRTVFTPREKEDAVDPLRQKRLLVKQEIHRELLKRLDIKRLSVAHVARDDLSKRAFSTLQDIVKDVATRLPVDMDPATVIKEVHNEAVGLGPLEDLLADEDVTEIMVNGHDHIYVERRGRLERTDLFFMDNSSVLAIMERIVSPIGRRIDESQPYVDARLPDGSRVNAIIHPLSLVGPCLTIRKFSKDPFTDEDLIRFDTMTRDIAEFIQVCVMLRKNIIISGGTGSGKTSLLNVVSSYLPHTERIVTIEDAAELRLGQEHVVRLESRPPNIEGRGKVAIRDLVRNALRMRPDRIVVGECRGEEALDMLQAMNTGHDGSLTTIHANSPRDVISRLETMVLMSGMDLPVRAIREQVASAIDVIVHEARFSDGSRKITRVTEVVGLEGDQITMQDIFEYEQTGLTEDGKVIGAFMPTGSVPTFVEELGPRGLSIRQGMFDPMEHQSLRPKTSRRPRV